MHLAEGEGFEPPEPVKAQRFSRPLTFVPSYTILYDAACIKKVSNILLSVLLTISSYMKQLRVLKKVSKLLMSSRSYKMD